MINQFIRMKRIFVVSIMCIFFCVSFMNCVYANDNDKQKNVLIINSYHQGFTWSKDVTDGIIDTFKKSDYNVSTFVEYMDWKNYPTNENMKYLQSHLKYKYQNKDIDMLIASDDAAVKFVLQNRESSFSNAPVVFCGLNQNGVAQIASGYKNITGVLEEIDPTETIKMAISINPSLKNVYILFDNSESGVSAGELTANKIKLMNADLNTIPLNILAYDELIKNVRSYDNDSIILFTTYYSDANGKIVEYENVARELSMNSSVPIYCLYDMGLNNGAIGGAMTGGKIHGESAANLAIRIFDGEDPDGIPVQSPKTIRKVFDFKQLKKFSISINEIPKDSEVINKPFSFFETYKTLVLSVLGAFIVLISFVCILLFYVTKINRMKRDLSESHEELSQTYEELSASQEELKQQYDQILDNNKKIKETEEKLVHLAYHDVLTGLPNKLSLYKDSHTNTSNFHNNKAALLFIDIDHFKYINDTMGHAFGDQLIVMVSKRLSSLLKDNCLIFRLSGDELIIIMQDINGKKDAEVFASQILSEFKKEFNVFNSIQYISLSIGIAIYPEHGKNTDELLRHADIAMYKAKETGRKKYVLFDKYMNGVFTERVNMEKYLHTALAKNEFVIYYQPQLDLKSNKITGFEALLRWKSPELGFVSPLKFIKVAEDTHLIIPLGTWVLKNACAFLKRLYNKGYSDLSVSINISMLQLIQTDFNDIVIETLDSFELDPDCLELEITESILMESFETVKPKLEKLRNQEIRIALDDFGMGYSSLSYLKQLPISTLKVDKSFIDNISGESDTKTLTGHIVTIGKSMGMCVIAEGVERQEQLDYLVQHKCDKIQGYLYSKPITEAELVKLLESG